MPRRIPAALRLVVTLPPALGERVARLLFEAGASGLEEQSLRGETQLILHGKAAELRRFASTARHALGDAAAGCIISIEPSSVDWVAAWRASLRPVALTPRIAIGPVGVRPQFRHQRALFYEPALAFGDGAHPTTRLAARALERLCRAHPGARVLDVGTGTGVLALVAAVSGAKRVLAIDVDPVALTAARRNVELNGCERRCEIAPRPLSRVRGRFDIVAANLLLSDQLALAPEMARMARHAGALLLTGFLVEDVAAIRAAYGGGVRIRSRARSGEWARLVLSPA